MNEPTICFCQATYGERIEQTKESARRIQPYVDRAIIIADQTVTEEQKQELRDIGCEVYFHEWHDDFVEMRNHYLEKLQTDSWVIVADPDEWFNQKFCEDIRKLIKRAEESNTDGLLINSHDTTQMRDGTVSKTVSDFWKLLIFRYFEGTHYEGKGEGGRVHEGITIPGMKKTARLSKEDYWYEHVKIWHEIWERAARNVFIGGGGINIGNRNPSWRPLRDVCEGLGMDTWPKLREYCREGNVDSKLKKWLWDNRFEGFDYQHEMMEFGRWYFEYLHPEEAEGWEAVTETPEDSPAGVMKYVEDVYMGLLGRHADQRGKEVYTRAILEGQIRKEDLPLILKQSPEYKEKVTPDMESIRIQVPINVEVKLNEELLVQALMRSKTYWNTVKPRLDIGKYLEEQLGDEWQEFQKWFYEENPTLKRLMKKLKEVS